MRIINGSSPIASPTLPTLNVSRTRLRTNLRKTGRIVSLIGDGRADAALPASAALLSKSRPHYRTSSMSFRIYGCHRGTLCTCPGRPEEVAIAIYTTTTHSAWMTVATQPAAGALDRRQTRPLPECFRVVLIPSGPSKPEGSGHRSIRAACRFCRGSRATGPSGVRGTDPPSRLVCMS